MVIEGADRLRDGSRVLLPGDIQRAQRTPASGSQPQGAQVTPAPGSPFGPAVPNPQDS